MFVQLFSQLVCFGVSFLFFSFRGGCLFFEEVSVTHAEKITFNVEKEERPKILQQESICIQSKFRKGSYFLFLYIGGLSFKMGSQMKINNATSLFILSVSSLLLSIFSSPFFHPFSLATGQLLFVSFVPDSVSYCKFSVSC